MIFPALPNARGIAARAAGLCALVAVCLGVCACARGPHRLASGPWRAWLESPGGELPFDLEIQPQGSSLSVWVLNGPERRKVIVRHFSDGELALDFDPYDAQIVARVRDRTGTALAGEWTKRRDAERWSRLPFRAVAGKSARFSPLGPAKVGGGPTDNRVDGRWAIQFATEVDTAVALLRATPPGTVTGTILTTTGDDRYLAGSFEENRLRLSCFDGSHAFLFDARLAEDGRLHGDYWSGDAWHDSWVAWRDSTVELADAFTQVQARRDTRLDSLRYRSLDGREVSLADTTFAGRARMLVLFGSWCPNCNDEAPDLVELDRRYRARGLSIVGLAFEVTGDFQRDAAQVRRFARRHGVTFPLLLAGVSDKQKASAAFPLLSRVAAFPTTIFLHADGRVRAVHSGYMGPATGTEHARLLQRFDQLVEELLEEPPHS